MGQALVNLDAPFALHIAVIELWFRGPILCCRLNYGPAPAFGP